MGPFRQFSGVFHTRMWDDRGLSSLFAQPPYRSRSSGSCRTSRRRSYNTMSPPCRSQPWPGGLRRGIVGGRAGAIGWTRTGHKRPSERGPRKRPTWRRAVGQGFAPASACGGTCGAGPRRRSASCTAGGWNTKSELGVRDNWSREIGHVRLVRADRERKRREIGFSGRPTPLGSWMPMPG